MRAIPIPNIFQYFIQSKRDTEALGISYAFISLLFLGTYTPLSKALSVYLSPISLILISEILVALFIILTIGLLPIVQILFRTKGKDLIMAMVIGVINSGMAPLLWYMGLQQTTAVNSSLIYSLRIIFILIMSVWIIREKVNMNQVIASGFVFIGVIIAALGTGSTMGIGIGDLYIFMGTMLFASGTILFKKYCAHMHPEVALFIRAATGIAFALMISAFLSHPYLAEFQAFPIEKIAMLFAFAFFSRFLQLTFFYAALDRAPVSKVSLIINASPISIMMFAVLILGEHIYWYHVIAGIFIVFGLMLEELSGKRVRKIYDAVVRSRAGHHNQI